jgi:dCTP deaminase
MPDQTPEIGTLNDEQIVDLCNRDELITQYFDSDQVQQACYELRAGKVYYDLTDGRQRHSISDCDDILIKPRHMVVIITLEKLELPPDIIGRILTKGAFFSLGLSPVNTYADPGFQGNLGIVLFNTSLNYIRVPFATSIAKIEFAKLQLPVRRPYSGQHGYQTSIWPIREDLILKPDEVRDDPRIDAPLDELRVQQGEFLATIVKRIFRYERRILILVASLLILNLLAWWVLQGTAVQMTTAFVALGILSNLATMGITLLATNMKGK